MKNFYNQLTKYQQGIVQCMMKGARLQSSEGANYKVWLSFPDGTTHTVRRDSAEKLCELGGEDHFIFGSRDGIYLK